MHFQTIDPKPYQLLQELMRDKDIEKAGFVLCGGGALALHLGHRQSTDIDLFSPKKDIGPDQMKAFMEKNFGDRVEVYNQSDLGIRGYLDGIKFDMIKFPYQMQHEPVVAEGIRVLDFMDAASMKLHAVANRGLRRDFYDLAEILQKMPLRELLEHYQKQFSPSPQAMSHTLKSLTFFNDAMADSNKVDVRNGRKWEQVQQIVHTAVRNPREVVSLNAPQKVFPINPHVKKGKAGPTELPQAKANGKVDVAVTTPKSAVGHPLQPSPTIKGPSVAPPSRNDTERPKMR